MRKLLIFFCLVSTTSYCQHQELLASSNISKNGLLAYLKSVKHTYESITKNIQKHTDKTIINIQKDDANIRQIFGSKKLNYPEIPKTDSLLQIATSIQQQEAGLKLNEYIPELDSLKTSIAFIENHYKKPPITDKVSIEQIQSLKATLLSFEATFQKANSLKKIIQQRKEHLNSLLQSSGLTKEFKRINKQAYYYHAQLQEYKNILKDKTKAKKLFVQNIRNSKPFKEFFKKNSQLAALFKLPDNYGTAQSIVGLQTSQSVQQLLSQRFSLSIGNRTGNPQQLLQQQVQTAQDQLRLLQNKLKLNNGSNSIEEIKSFKPNTQKTKSFWKRLEKGFNIQSSGNKGVIPALSDIALTLGYKLNDKSVIGIGASYKLGIQASWKYQKFTSEGMGLRTYVDIKLKGNLWMSGGFEANFLQAFNTIEALKIYDAWQSSGLIGVSKKYTVGKKTATVQLLWDFLHYQQNPRIDQAIKFRIGYSFN